MVVIQLSQPNALFDNGCARRLVPLWPTLSIYQIYCKLRPRPSNSLRTSRSRHTARCLMADARSRAPQRSCKYRLPGQYTDAMAFLSHPQRSMCQDTSTSAEKDASQMSGIAQRWAALRNAPQCMSSTYLARDDS
jgi:hypothetical protein